MSQRRKLAGESTLVAPQESLEENRILEEVLRAIRSIKYGCVQITLHDSRVVQIEKTEKIRMTGGSQ